MWAIFYEGGRVFGETEEDWKFAREDGVQAIVLYETPLSLRWSCEGQVVRDRQLWTGEDTYDPFGWGLKRGSLISDVAYWRIWKEAALGDY